MAADDAWAWSAKPQDRLASACQVADQTGGGGGGDEDASVGAGAGADMMESTDRRVPMAEHTADSVAADDEGRRCKEPKLANRLVADCAC